MQPPLATVIAWSYGLAGVSYAALALRLAFVRQPGIRGSALLVAVASSAAWGLLVMAYALLAMPIALMASALAEQVRTAGWFAFLLLLGGSVYGATRSASVRRVHWLSAIAEIGRAH